MGKTLQTITTLLDNRPKLQHSLPGTKHPPSYTEEMIFKLNNEEQLWEGALKEWKHEMKMNDVPASVLPKTKKSGVGGGGGARAGTLVICPVIALTQWKVNIYFVFIYTQTLLIASNFEIDPFSLEYDEPFRARLRNFARRMH